MNDLYATLGIEKNATKKQIKAAYRWIMKDIHPDVNGGVRHPEHEDFQTAYEVLSDPERRAEYDKTGTVEAIDLARLKITEMIQAIAKQADSETVQYIDVKGSIVQALEQEKRNIDNSIGEIERKAEMLQEMTRRTHAEGRSQFIPFMIYAGIQETEKVIKEARRDIETIDDALAIMADFEYTFEERQQQRHTTNAWTLPQY